MKRTLVIAAVVLPIVSVVPAHASGAWAWPVTGAITRGFDPPDSPFGAGHRGIDIGAPVGSPVRAPAAGTVSFAGNVGGRLFVTIDHGAGLLSTCSYLSTILVHKGDVVAQGQEIGRSGDGHVGDVASSLHFGVRLNGQYVDPLDYLGPLSVVDLIRLAPIEALVA